MFRCRRQISLPELKNKHLLPVPLYQPGIAVGKTGRFFISVYCTYRYNLSVKSRKSRAYHFIARCGYKYETSFMSGNKSFMHGRNRENGFQDSCLKPEDHYLLPSLWLLRYRTYAPPCGT